MTWSSLPNSSTHRTGDQGLTGQYRREWQPEDRPGGWSQETDGCEQRPGQGDAVDPQAHDGTQHPARFPACRATTTGHFVSGMQKAPACGRGPTCECKFA